MITIEYQSKTNLFPPLIQRNVEKYFQRKAAPKETLRRTLTCIFLTRCNPLIIVLVPPLQRTRLTLGHTCLWEVGLKIIHKDVLLVRHTEGCLFRVPLDVAVGHQQGSLLSSQDTDRPPCPANRGKKYRIGKEKECFLWGTHIWMMWQARKFWLLVKQSSCQPPTWTGKAIQVEQCWIQQHNEGLGSDELKEPSQLMLLSQEKETSDNYRTPVKQPLWCTWAPHSSPTQTCSSLTVIISPSCWR